MLVIVFPPAHAAEAPAAVQGDGPVVGGPDLQRQKRQLVGLGKVQEHLQQLLGDAVAAALRPHGHIGDVPLVQHRL